MAEYIKRENAINGYSNADHLRDLPDEELAEEIMNWFAALYTVEWNTETVLEYLREPYEVEHE